MNVMLLIPAYGRRYHTEAELLAAWDRGEDFKIHNGPYTSKRDIEILKSYGLPISLFCLDVSAVLV